MRLFLAITLEEEVKNQIGTLINKISRYSMQGRFVSKENLHLTLEFLGEMEEERVAILKEILNDLTYPPFPLKFTDLGYFTSRKGKTYWLGIEKTEELENLQRGLHQKLLVKHFKVEDRAFLPHITIGRELKFKSELDKMVVKNQLENIETMVERIELMESKIVAGKRVYSIIHSADLH